MKSFHRFAETVLNWLFSCHHRRLSRVMTLDHQTVVICIDCGTRFRYSWQSMSIVKGEEPTRGTLTRTSPAH